jgi:hypothetical protein
MYQSDFAAWPAQFGAGNGLAKKELVAAQLMLDCPSAAFPKSIMHRH